MCVSCLSKMLLRVGDRCNACTTMASGNATLATDSLTHCTCDKALVVWPRRYMEAFERLAGSDSNTEVLSASNAAEAATTLAAVADMMLKMGEVEEASKSLTTSLNLLQQHPGQLPALQVAFPPCLHHCCPTFLLG